MMFEGHRRPLNRVFIIAAHLDPTQKSHLTELLARCAKMPVVQIENSTQVEPNHVYVIAPDQELTIKDGVVRTNKPTAPRGHRHPVDSSFRSLAEGQGERAIAIVLSGAGTNGSLGLRFIKAEGGIAIAQEPDTAAFQGMPRSAIGTGSSISSYRRTGCPNRCSGSPATRTCASGRERSRRSRPRNS
jgi:two-component system CheB/CheR fusion protein